MKEEQFRKAKEHLKYLDDVLAQNKKDRKKQRGHLFHNQYDNVPLGSAEMILYSVGLTALFLLGVKLPLGLAIAAGCLGGFIGSFVVPRAIHFSILKFAKGKLGRGYAKLEVDNHFSVMKWFYKKYFPKLYKAKSSDEVSRTELNAFARQIHVFAENGKTNLDKNIFKKITKRNKSDLQKIAKLNQRMTNREALQKKVDRIIEKNNKFTKPWCEVYNSCAAKMRDLYVQAHEIDNDLSIPKDYEFGLNPQALQNMVAKHVDKSLVTTQRAFNSNSFEDNKDDRHYASNQNNYSRIRTHNDDMNYGK